MPSQAVWRDFALCRLIGHAMFFDEDRVSQDCAKTVCRQCPVREPCRMAGEKEEYGIWGGMTPPERRKERRLDSQVPHEDEAASSSAPGRRTGQA